MSIVTETYPVSRTSSQEPSPAAAHRPQAWFIWATLNVHAAAAVVVRALASRREGWKASDYLGFVLPKPRDVLIGCGSLVPFAGLVTAVAHTVVKIGRQVASRFGAWLRHKGGGGHRRLNSLVPSVRILLISVCRAAVIWMMQEKLRPVLFGRSCFGIVLAFAMLVANGAVSEIIKKEDLLRGITISRAQCEATSQTVWLTVDGRGFCVRYYLSTAGGEGPRPVVFLQGDRIASKFDLKTWTWIDPSKAEDIDTDDLMKIADGLSKMAKTTAIYLARMGVEGTSGNHIFRKTALELDLMNAALDAIKRRHGFVGFHLAGQSGGSRIAAGLIGLRRDISCLVLGSGHFASAPGGKSSDPERSYFDVIQNVPQLAQNRSIRVFLLTDKLDKWVPAKHQTEFGDRLRRAGRQIPQFFVEATDDHHHGVVAYTQLAVAGCVLDRSDEEIARALDTIVKRSTEYNQRRRKEIEAKPSIEAAARQPVPGTGLAQSGK
jgi:hypothetical protein